MHRKAQLLRPRRHGGDFGLVGAFMVGTVADDGSVAGRRDGLQIAHLDLRTDGERVGDGADVHGLTFPRMNNGAVSGEP